MTKLEFVDSIANKTGFTHKDSANALNAVLDTIKQELCAGNKVQITGFGTFEVKERAARSGRNPQTGATMEIAACKRPSFKAGKSLKDAVNQ